MEMVKRFWREEEALTAVEYAIMLALLALVVTATMALMFQNIAGIFGKWADWFGNTPTPSSIGGGGGGE